VDDYIDLDRRFVNFDPKLHGERDNHFHRLGSIWGSAKTWSDVLEQRCTVIIAEAGNGKSVELRRQAALLRGRGEAAFFCNLGLLAKMPLHRALEIGSADELAAWQQGTAQGTFFLDAVDEAKLADPRDFQVALANYLDAIEAHGPRVTTILSTRPHSWQAYADRAMLAARLGLPSSVTASKAEVTPGEEPIATQAASDEPDDADDEQGTQQDPPAAIAVMQLEPLDEARIRIFARARGVADTDLDAFIAAIERADADLFATRPADLPGLIKIWKKEGKIGSYSQVVASNVELKLAEVNTTHQRFSIALDRAMAGAETLAAAVTFGQRTAILLPDQPVAEGLRAQALDPASVLSTWKPEEIETLLGRALFDESLYGTVRFHHRTTREYLTARWLKRCLKNHKSRRRIEGLLFARPYGKGNPVVIPSMKPVVGWLAGWDQRIRDAAMRIDPKVLLEHGDVRALDIDTRARLLAEFARRYENRKHTPLSLHIREVRRLAEQRLAPQIRELLARYRGHDDVRQLLLRIIREGALSGCGQAVMPFAVDDGMDAYTRSCAVQAIGMAGTAKERREAAGTIVARAATLDPQILGAAIETLWPDALSIADIVTILEHADPPEAFSSTHLDAELDRLAERIGSRADRLALLRSVVALLKQPPLHDEYRPISQRYDWLLPLASKLAHSLAAESPVDPAVLSALAMAACAGQMHRYMGDADKHARELIAATSAIRQQLFWHLVADKRARSCQPVTDWWFAAMTPEVTAFDAADLDHYLDEIAARPLMDDKRIALSVVATIYARQGRPPETLTRLERAVAGNPTLAAELAKHLTPATPSSELRGSERELAAIEERNRENKQRDEADRTRWIGVLRDDPSKIGDLDIAADGKVWGNTAWLADEIRKKRKSSSSRWTIDRWELLEPEFGAGVAQAFRDFCIAFWRRYRPQLRSEIGQDTSSVPWAVIIGLSGIAMEARQGSGWAARLSADEACLAARYALWEMNGLPPWFATLCEAHPAPVADVLLGELRWEFVTPRPQQGAGYVLARLRWNAKELGQALRSDLIDLVAQHEMADVTTLAEALTVILRDPRPLPASFTALMLDRAEAAGEDARKALWLAAGLCLDAKATLSRLERWADEGSTPQACEERLTPVLEHVWGNRFDSFTSEHKHYLQPSFLARLLKLTHRHIRTEDDTHRGGAVTSRHTAQDARRHLLELLLSIPGEPTYLALHDLAGFHSAEYPRDRMLVLAEQRAELDVEHRAWAEGEVAQFADEAERDPATEAELFRIALSRLDDLKLDLEEGDESEASLLRKAEDEPELRQAIAHRLRQAAHFKYTTGSEEELADKSRTDIRLHSPRVEQRVPVEIKIAGKWSGEHLKERLANQLGGQYLRGARHGIFLVVNRGAEGDRKSWKLGRRAVDFDELIAALAAEASALLRASTTMDGLEVIGIDLLRRAVPDVLPKGKRGRAANKHTGSKTARPREERSRTR
jgi:hypothetical protein